jgi:hypothetical protein
MLMLLRKDVMPHRGADGPALRSDGDRCGRGRPAADGVLRGGADAARIAGSVALESLIGWVCGVVLLAAVAVLGTRRGRHRESPTPTSKEAVR